MRGAWGLLVFMIFTMHAGAAEQSTGDTVELEKTIISGDEELPKVLYIQPWQSPGGVPGLAMPPQTDLHWVLRRVYPQSYRRALELETNIRAQGPSRRQ